MPDGWAENFSAHSSDPIASHSVSCYGCREFGGVGVPSHALDVCGRPRTAVRPWRHRRTGPSSSSDSKVAFMVIVGRGWSAEAGRAARDNRVLCARLLLLFGFITIAWLAGGIGVAHGGAAPEPGESTGDVTDLEATVEERETPQREESHGAWLPDTADNVIEDGATEDGATEDDAIDAGITEMTESSTEEVTEPPIEILEDTGASTVLERTTTGDTAGQIMDETFRAVDETVHVAGGLVEGMVHTGQETVEGTDDQLRETDLVDTITDGLYEPAGEIDPRRYEATPTPAVTDP